MNEKLEGMAGYIGASAVCAKPMTRGEYGQFKGIGTPGEEDLNEAGYIVQFEDGYILWTPAQQFEESYIEEQPEVERETLNFASALTYMLKSGVKIARAGWNGNGMFIFLVNGSTFEVNRAPLNEIYPEGTVVNYLPHVDMRTANGDIVPWLASQSDILANDWYILTEEDIA